MEPKIIENATRSLIGRRILCFGTVTSTNDVARDLLEADMNEGVVVVADRQIQGRGRYGRSWSSPPGGLYMTIILSPEHGYLHALTLISGIPAVKALRHWGILASLKWPNDIVFMEKKIGGILCEGVYRSDRFFVLCGIGVNTDVSIEKLPENIRPFSTTLKNEVDSMPSNEDFMNYLLQHFDRYYARFRSGSRDVLIREYRGLCTTTYRTVEVKEDHRIIRGKAVDVTSTGSLVVVDDKGNKAEIAEGTLRYLD